MVFGTPLPHTTAMPTLSSQIHRIRKKIDSREEIRREKNAKNSENVHIPPKTNGNQENSWENSP